jgi:hypothetical protein
MRELRLRAPAFPDGQYCLNLEARLRYIAGSVVDPTLHEHATSAAGHANRSRSLINGKESARYPPAAWSRRDRVKNPVIYLRDLVKKNPAYFVGRVWSVIHTN